MDEVLDGILDEVLRVIGLPVTCRACGTKGFVKPHTDYGGWYRSKWGPKLKRWLCPDHAEAGRKFDKQFTDRYKTPEGSKQQAEIEETTVEELYKLLD